MKQINTLLLLAMLLTGLASCKKNNDAAPVSLTVKVALDADNAALGFTLDKATVNIKNTTTSQSYNAAVTADGTATFPSIAAGDYGVTSTLTIKAAEYNAKSGSNVKEDVIFNGTLNKQMIVANKQLTITLKTGRVGDLVIKQVYYAGSNAANGAVFRDQFIEIYNNSSETLYADSLYIAQLLGNNGAVLNVDHSKAYYQSTGQWDWSKSLNMANPSTANTEFVYAKNIFMIPGTGKQYPVLPGKSIIIAATALNHQAPYTGVDGKAIAVKDPSLTVDLSNADFEVYLGNYPGINPLASDVDNPSVPNLSVILNVSNRDLILDNLGRDAVVIFKSNADPKNWTKYPTPDITQITISTNLYTQIPVPVIIDGVCLQHANAASKVARRTPEVVDAGDIFVTGGSYSSQSVVRKTAKNGNGRIVLKDSNNSTNDFGVLLKADPSKGASSFIN